MVWKVVSSVSCTLSCPSPMTVQRWSTHPKSMHRIHRVHRRWCHRASNGAFQVQPDKHALQGRNGRGWVLEGPRMLPDALEQNRHAVPAFLRHVHTHWGQLWERCEHCQRGLKALRLTHRRGKHRLGHRWWTGGGGRRSRNGVLSIVHERSRLRTRRRVRLGLAFLPRSPARTFCSSTGVHFSLSLPAPFREGEIGRPDVMRVLGNVCIGVLQ